MSPANGNSTAFVDDVTLSDGGKHASATANFESPVLPIDGYSIAPAGSAWQFSGTAGVTANNSGFTYVSSKATANVPNGTQDAFIKNNGSMSQTVYFDAGTYNISFLASQRIALSDPDPANRGAGRWHVRRSDHACRRHHFQQHSLQHHVRLHSVPDLKFHGRGRPAHGRIPRHESARRQRVDSTAFIDDPAINVGSAARSTAVSRNRPWPRRAYAGRARRRGLAVLGRSPESAAMPAPSPSAIRLPPTATRWPSSRTPAA